jgi:hypothetical protein
MKHLKTFEGYITIINKHLSVEIDKSRSEVDNVMQALMDVYDFQHSRTVLDDETHPISRFGYEALSDIPLNGDFFKSLDILSKKLSAMGLGFQFSYLNINDRHKPISKDRIKLTELKRLYDNERSRFYKITSCEIVIYEIDFTNMDI